MNGCTRRVCACSILSSVVTTGNAAEGRSEAAGRRRRAERRRRTSVASRAPSLPLLDVTPRPRHYALRTPLRPYQNIPAPGSIRTSLALPVITDRDPQVTL